MTESIYLIFFWKRIVSFKPRNLNSIPIEGRVFKCILTCISKLSTILLRFVHIWSMFTMTYFGGRKNNRPPGKFSHYLVIRYGYLSNSWMKILKVCKQKNYESTTNLRYLCGWLHCVRPNNKNREGRTEGNSRRITDLFIHVTSKSPVTVNSSTFSL